MDKVDSTSLIAVEAEAAPSQASVRLDVPSVGTIGSVEDLREHLQWAIELEHSTIPPYLCALYSIEPGRNLEAVEVISSVVVEEMLHLTLAANLLNAVGGRPRLDISKMLPGYPRPLPHSDRSFEISLFRFGPEAIESFLKIEKPSPKIDHPEGDSYETIGQFYQAIERGFRELSAILGEANLFCGDAARQVTDQHFYSGGGASSLSLTLPLRWLRKRKLWNKERVRPTPAFLMEIAMCFILNGIRSLITTAFRNSSLAEDIAAETRRGQALRVIRSRLTGMVSDPCVLTRVPRTMSPAARFALPRKSSTNLIARFCKVSRRRLTAPHKCLGQRSEQCTRSKLWPRD
jgi:hypothetical protein